MKRLLPLAAVTLLAILAAIAPRAARGAIFADSPEAALINREAIQDATGELVLPRGEIRVDRAPILTGSNSGLILCGKGSTIVCKRTAGGYIDRAALAIRCGLKGMAAMSWRTDERPGRRPAVMPASEVGWLFDGDGMQLIPKPNQRILAGQPVPDSPLEFMRAFHGVPFAGGPTEFAVPEGHGLKVGAIVWATDGPYINECVGEFAAIVSAETMRITLNAPLKRSYSQGTFVAGPFPARIKLRDLTLAGPQGTLICQQAADLELTNVTVLPGVEAHGSAAGWASFIGCGGITLRRCVLPGLGMSSGCGMHMVECRSPCVKAEQAQVDVTLERCKIGWLDSASRCDRWTLTDCEFSEWFGIYDEWTVNNCHCDGIVYIRGRGCRVTGLTTKGAVIVQSDYAGHPPGAATDVKLDRLTAASVELKPGTSGQITNCTAPIVCRDPATRSRWTLDGKPLP